MSRTGPFTSTVGRAAAAVRQHFADPTFYARRYRAAVDARDGAPPRRLSAAGSGPFRDRLWWLPPPRRGDPQPKAQPDAVERWMRHPAFFLPAATIGLATVVATLDVARDAPLYRQFIVMLGVVAAWFGLTGAISYVGRRWPRAEPALVAMMVLLSVVAILYGGHFAGRAAVGNMLLQLGLFTSASLAVAWWKNRPGKGGG